ncbi:MAG: phosphoribosylformylglycinamidine synthase subunit PurQ, partial [Gemmatimonadota bacterium]
GLLRNDHLQFRSMPVTLRVESTATVFTRETSKGALLTMPIAHGDGRYSADEATLDRLEGEGQVVFRYVDAAGHPTAAANPNGSLRNIAGVANATGTVVGLMPHPERALDPPLGSTDGLVLVRSLLALTTA